MENIKIEEVTSYVRDIRDNQRVGQIEYLHQLFTKSLDKNENNFNGASLLKMANTIKEYNDFKDFINQKDEHFDFVAVYIKNSLLKSPLDVNEIILSPNELFEIDEQTGYYNSILGFFNGLKSHTVELIEFYEDFYDAEIDYDDIFNESIINNIASINICEYLKINEELFFEPVRDYIFEKTGGEDREILLKTYTEALENQDITDEDEESEEIIIEYFKDAKYIIELTRGSSSEYERLNSSDEIVNCVSDILKLNLKDFEQHEQEYSR